MELASDDSGAENNMFRDTFRPIEQKKKKKIKISVPKDLPREESSPEIVEFNYGGHKIRNAPDYDPNRKSRWDAKQDTFRVPSTKEVLEQQGL